MYSDIFMRIIKCNNSVGYLPLMVDINDAPELDILIKVLRRVYGLQVYIAATTEATSDLFTGYKCFSPHLILGTCIEDNSEQEFLRYIITPVGEFDLLFFEKFNNHLKKVDVVLDNNTKNILGLLEYVETQPIDESGVLHGMLLQDLLKRILNNWRFDDTKDRPYDSEDEDEDEDDEYDYDWYDCATNNDWTDIPDNYETYEYVVSCLPIF